MADKFHKMGAQEGEQWIAFHCPGCEGGHGIPVSGPRGWTWNGSLDKPTVTPSILVNVNGGNPTTPVCHSFIKEGNIIFLTDCTHQYAGQIIEIPDWD